MGEYDFKAAELCREILHRRAVDITFSTSGRTALVVAPHPDDETFGCGATIARKRAAGTDVHICVVSDGGAFPTDELSPAELVRMRKQNFSRACAALGADEHHVDMLGFPDRGTTDRIDDIAKEIADIIERVGPDDIFIPSSYDVHQDHMAVYAATTQAIKTTSTSAALYTYPVWFWSRDTWTPRGNSSMDRVLSRFRILMAGLYLRPVKVNSSLFIDAKREAMEHFAWELQPDREFFEHWSLGPEELFFVYAPSGKRRA
jgi:LmbE family N-acetylglucosaminyl deacetylase